MALKPTTKRRVSASKDEAIAMEARLTRIETQLDTLINSLQTLPQSPSCAAGISDLKQKIGILDERLHTHVKEEDWQQDEVKKIETRLKSIETRTTYWMGSIAVMTPLALLAVKALADLFVGK